MNVIYHKYWKNKNLWVYKITEREIENSFATVEDGYYIDYLIFGLNPTEDNYFVTAFDMYSLKKGLEALNNLKEPLNLTKVLFSKEMLKEEDDYLNFLSVGLKIVWKEFRIYFPIENGDAIVLAENERLAKIKFKPLSAQYKESLLYIAEEILKDATGSQLRRAMKIIERDKGV